MKQKGFTLIELLVVIVIIGILATISVATFSGYFAKARDAERQAAVRNAATVLKTSRAVDTISAWPTTALDFSNALAGEGQYFMPLAKSGYTYGYYVDSTAQEFAIAVCSEETPQTAFVDGTGQAVTTITALALEAGCDPQNGTPVIVPIAVDIAGNGAVTPIDVSGS